MCYLSHFYPNAFSKYARSRRKAYRSRHETCQRLAGETLKRWNSPLSNLRKSAMDDCRPLSSASYYRRRQHFDAWWRRLSPGNVNFKSVRVHEILECGNSWVNAAVASYGRTQEGLIEQWPISLINPHLQKHYAARQLRTHMRSVT